jgi:hypothetical protein
VGFVAVFFHCKCHFMQFGIFFRDPSAVLCIAIFGSNFIFLNRPVEPVRCDMKMCPSLNVLTKLC